MQLHIIVSEIEKKRYFRVTKLTVIKKWFNTEHKIKCFCIFMAKIIFSQLRNAKKLDNDTQIEALLEETAILLSEATEDVMNEKIGRPLVQSLYEYQCDIKKYKWSNIRLIHNPVLCLLETCLDIFFNTPDERYVYRFISQYCSKYDPSCAYDLIAKSVRCIKNIIDFVTLYENTNIFSQNKTNSKDTN